MVVKWQGLTPDGEFSPRQDQKAEVLSIAEIFRARVVDSSAKTYTLEVTGDEKKLKPFINLLKLMDIKEFVRTGNIAMAREGTKA